MEHLLYQSILVFWLFIGVIGAVAAAHDSTFKASFWVLAIVCTTFFLLKMGG